MRFLHSACISRYRKVLRNIRIKSTWQKSTSGATPPTEEDIPQGPIPLGDAPLYGTEADAVDINEDGTARITIPGLSVANFTHAGKLCMKGIHDVLVTGSWAIRKHSDFGGFRRLHKEGSTLFVLATDILVHKDFHEITKTKWLNLPMDFYEGNYSFGKTSYTFDRMVCNQRTKVPYIEASDTWVTIQWKTRRPQLHPDWFRMQFPIPGTSKKLPYIPAPLPENTFKMPAVIVPRDIDSNLHVIQNQFIRFVMDCASLACQQNFYPNFSGDVYKREVLHQQVLYVGEARLGHTLQVDTWEDNNDINTLHFLITNSDGKALLHCKTSFYQEE